MTNNTPDISFITICYNGFKDTCELIESLQSKIHSVSYEIIVVDNASREDEATQIHNLYPSVIAIRSNENGGFSGGNNIGIRAAKGKYIFLINNDTYIESDNIAYLIERLESRPEIGGVSPKIRFAFPPQHIQFAGFTPLSQITLRNNMLGFDCPDDGMQLDRNLSNKRIFPAVNITASSTRRDDLLLDKTTLDRMWILRKYLADMNPIEAMDFVKDRLEKTRDNDEFLMSMNS